MQENKTFIGEVPPPARDVFESFVKGFPEVAEEKFLNSPATIENIFAAKLQFMRYAFKNDFLDQYTKVMDIEPALVQFLSDSWEEILVGIEPFAEKATEMFESYGISQEEALHRSGMELIQIKRWKLGMTVAEFYVENPYVIIKNTD